MLVSWITLVSLFNTEKLNFRREHIDSLCWLSAILVWFLFLNISSCKTKPSTLAHGLGMDIVSGWLVSFEEIQDTYITKGILHASGNDLLGHGNQDTVYHEGSLLVLLFTQFFFLQIFTIYISKKIVNISVFFFARWLSAYSTKLNDILYLWKIIKKLIEWSRLLLYINKNKYW